MRSMRDVYVVGATRTAIGTYGGALKDMPLSQLATIAVKSALERSGVPFDQVGHLAMGTVIPTEPRDLYLSRVAAINAGLPKETCAFNVNRLCGSGVQAIISASQSIMLGDCEIAIGAGAESMSRSLFSSPAMRWGARMGDTQLTDFMLGTLQDPFHNIHMGITAENVADEFGITRDMMDQLAAESHRRAFNAMNEGIFKSQITPVELNNRKGTTTFALDEQVKSDTTLQTLAKMKPAFKKDGRVTAGNSSGLNDGAAALVLASDVALKDHALQPLARLVSYAHAGIDPKIMGVGAIPASRKALKLAGLTVNDLSVIEANEAFAAQACAVTREMNFDPAKVNPHGSGISLGHPIGGTGAIISTKAIYELQRTGGRYALVTMCIGGGQGIAAIFERM